METQSLLAYISHNDLCKTVAAIRQTNTCTHLGIFAHEWQVQLVAVYFPHFYAKYYQQKL